MPPAALFVAKTSPAITKIKVTQCVIGNFLVALLERMPK